MQVDLMQRLADDETEVSDQRFELRAAGFGIRALPFNILLQNLPIRQAIAEILNGTGERAYLIFAFATGDGDRQISRAQAVHGLGELREGSRHPRDEHVEEECDRDEHE
jgi:hypothetical protein